MEALKIINLCKEYPKFRLENVSFSVLPGTIMGFIGRNGAGKTTTLKAILNLIHKTSGRIEYFGLDLEEYEGDIKQKIGYSGGTIDYYKRKKIIEIVDVTKKFYRTWDDEAYHKYMDMFNLDENKKPMELSEGMKVKLNLALALSHHAEFLILDEPTSGLDPVSRDEVLTIFKKLKDEGVAILFSTHITSDLDKCADYITYIKNGKLIASLNKKEFMDEYKEHADNLEDIMLYLEKRDM